MISSASCIMGMVSVYFSNWSVGEVQQINICYKNT